MIAAAASKIDRSNFILILLRSAGLPNDVHKGRFARAHSCQRALKRRTKIVRIRHWTLGVQAVTLRNLRVVDVRIVERGADMRVVGYASTARTHALIEQVTARDASLGRALRTLATQLGYKHLLKLLKKEQTL